MSSFLVTYHRRSRQKGRLRRKTYFLVLGLYRRLVEIRLHQNHLMGWSRTEGNEMVRDRDLEPTVVPTRWDLPGISLGGAPMWPCSGGADFTE